MNADQKVVALRRMRQVPPVEVPEEAVRPRGRGLGLTIRDLLKLFGDQEVLAGLNLEVAPGEFVAIVGHSGCGKSTLLRLLAGLESPSRGSILFDGERTERRGPEVRLMFQDARLLPWRRVVDNVAISSGGGAYAAAMRALAEVGLRDRYSAWPSELSGGQKQRVALARALASEPRVLLLDEPLGALDALTRLEMQILIETVWREQGFTALLVTHDVAEAVALADRIVVLRDGRVSLTATVDAPRPRHRGDPELAAIEGRVLAHLMNRQATRR